MPTLTFDNAFVRELPADPEEANFTRQVHAALYSRVRPTPVSAPKLVAHSREVAEALGIEEKSLQSPELVEVLGGNALLPGMIPFAANYGGHQFGHWAGQLGDGRAISLGEIVTKDGSRFELQLKGAGPTPYSRRGDGRAVLRSSIREFLCSEAMHHLGVPTTRALSLVATGDLVLRDMFYDGRPKHEPGAIVCRVAPSFLRFGSFELLASRGEVDLLKRLADFCIRRDFPHLEGEGEALYEAWFREICERTAVMIAHWMRVGFVHGVMNTDNMSVLGLTIDYGPYGFLDDFDPNFTPNTTDAGQRRYRFGAQPNIAGWNLARFAEALYPLFSSLDPLREGLDHYVATYVQKAQENAASKLGLAECRDEDTERMRSLQILLHEAEVDMTIFFRTLCEVDFQSPSFEAFTPAFYDEQKRERFEPRFREWLSAYAERLRDDPLSEDERRARMRGANPRFILRNYLAQEAINRAEKGDYEGITELLELVRRPYEDQPGRERFAARRPDWAKDRPGCSALSCSS